MWSHLSVKRGGDDNVFVLDGIFDVVLRCAGPVGKLVEAAVSGFLCEVWRRGGGVLWCCCWDGKQYLAAGFTFVCLGKVVCVGEHTCLSSLFQRLAHLHLSVRSISGDTHRTLARLDELTSQFHRNHLTGRANQQTSNKQGSQCVPRH